ncbi:hypothetical protein Patl1_21989 [Pistacia atlantica]|uniref:Uncharacterized protein n=1 Tax=Pistacia atlantica TaxID=434234 RepID=A0ACC1BK56_9ROSI|nr:hypothetical protein Patl1_21989 [Pistacia atlantica]
MTKNNRHLSSSIISKVVIKATKLKASMSSKNTLKNIVNGKTRIRSGHKRRNASGHFHSVAHYEFLPGNPKWPANKYHLTCAFLAVAGSPADAMNPVAKAFTTWAGNTHFTFSVTQDTGNADLTIDDGKSHYDADETWSVGAVQGAIDLGSVALHEIGRLLGVGHSSVEGAIMFPTIPPGVTNRNLHGDDIQGIRALYNV